jgi:hypothetical protein
LRQERFEHQGAMADRRDAWASLLSLFRLVHDGDGADPGYLPARHGELFDPEAYPFLEGRQPGSSSKDEILTNLPAATGRHGRHEFRPDVLAIAPPGPGRHRRHR